jgi:hypothetical protein
MPITGSEWLVLVLVGVVTLIWSCRVWRRPQIRARSLTYWLIQAHRLRWPKYQGGEDLTHTQIRSYAVRGIVLSMLAILAGVLGLVLGVAR